MPNSVSEQAIRRDAIRKMLQHAPADTQQSLVDALNDQGLGATQSSVSRDLKDLGAIKTKQGYELPGGDTAALDELVALADFVRAVLPAGPNLTVIKTATGAAQRVALALDRSNWPEMVGNIGGDDTVFVATQSAASQKAIIARIAQVRA